jgi:DnaJ-class molecular chaperone
MKVSLRELRKNSQDVEIRCDACEGKGFPSVAQPLQPGRKVYPAPCRKCAGKGRLKAA